MQVEPTQPCAIVLREARPKSDYVMTPKDAKREEERKRFDRALDRELEATFPASDPLKITRPKRKKRAGGIRPRAADKTASK